MKVEVNNAQQNEQVDWTKKQLVISIVTCDVFLVLENGRNHFDGINLNSLRIINALPKANFKPFHGTITLQND